MSTYNVTILLDGAEHVVSVSYGPNRPKHATIIALQMLADQVVDEGRYDNADEALRGMQVPHPPVVV